VRLEYISKILKITMDALKGICFLLQAKGLKHELTEEAGALARSQKEKPLRRDRCIRGKDLSGELTALSKGGQEHGCHRRSCSHCAKRPGGPRAGAWTLGAIAQ